MLALAVVAGACAGSGGGGGGAGGRAGDSGGGGSEEADRLYQEGLSWAKRAETAPLPTPDPATVAGASGGAFAAAPEFKPEELRAIESFEKALSAHPNHAGANLALGDLLAPHALRRLAAQRARDAAAKRRPPKGQVAAPVPPAPVSTVDASPERVLRAYQAALQADPGRTPADRLIAFAVPAGRLDVAEAAHHELLRRVKERSEPYALYGDFLAMQKKDVDGAIDQYRQALIWRADDEDTRRKLADIHLARGVEYYGRQEFSRAAIEFKESAKYVTDRDSEQGRRLQTYLTRMKEIRR
jgi:tetratricopeptide (TPR) repeat protein